MSPRYVLITCDVFTEELTALTAQHIPWAARYDLEMGLHDRPAQLRTELQELIARVEHEHPEIDAIFLLYGVCGNALSGVRAHRVPLVLPRVHDCIAMLLGSQARHREIQQQHPRSYFASPGWVRGKRIPGPDRDKLIREQLVERATDEDGLDEELLEDLIDADTSSFSAYANMAWIDTVPCSAGCAYSKTCAQHMGWKSLEIPGDLSYLHDAIQGHWDERFVKIRPGNQVVVVSDDNVFAEREISQPEVGSEHIG